MNKLIVILIHIFALLALIGTIKYVQTKYTDAPEKTTIFLGNTENKCQWSGAGKKTKQKLEIFLNTLFLLSRLQTLCDM
jgi:uncharacterized protein YhhL (DUF1145 family)